MTPCRCPAYKFPHRKGGGDCTPETRAEPDEEAADRWLAGMIRNPRPVDKFRAQDYRVRVRE